MSFGWRNAIRGIGCLLLVGVVLHIATTESAAAEEARPRRFFLNEDMIREVGTPPDPQACSPSAVLDDLFKQISPVATVYPTENYYYFGFYRGGKSYSGSLRLSVDTRDKGVVQYVCYETYTGWLEIDPGTEVRKDLSNDDGVLVTKVSDFEYDIAFRGSTVRFVLNRVDQTPDREGLGRDEYFVGRIFDESGLLFELVYNKAEKTLYFVLDTKQRVNDAFVQMRSGVYVGKRTGFVLFQEADMKRFILIAAHSAEIDKNTWYDGPFDQLPENFYRELGFWDYVYDAHPELRGKLTPGGVYLDSDLIFAIFPYRQYSSREDLDFVESCTGRNLESVKLILCLTGQTGAEGRR